MTTEIDQHGPQPTRVSPASKQFQGIPLDFEETYSNGATDLAIYPYGWWIRCFLSTPLLWFLFTVCLLGGIFGGNEVDGVDSKGDGWGELGIKVYR